MRRIKKIVAGGRWCKDFLKEGRFYANKDNWKKYAEFGSSSIPLRLYQWAYVVTTGKFPLDTLTEGQSSLIWATEPCRGTGEPINEDNSGILLDVNRRFPLEERDNYNRNFYELLGFRRATALMERVPGAPFGVTLLENPVDGFQQITGPHKEVDKVVAQCIAEGIPVKGYYLYRDLILTEEERMHFQRMQSVPTPAIQAVDALAGSVLHLRDALLESRR